MLLTRLLFSLFFVLLFFNINFLNAKTITYAFVKYKKLRVREEPSRKGKIIYMLKRNNKVEILDKKGVYYRIKVNDANIEGWSYYKGFYKFQKVVLPDYKVNFEFNAINKETENKILEFKRILNFDFYKRDVKVTFSYEKKYNTGRIFVETDFNQNYYNSEKAPSLKSNQVDLYPFLKFGFIFKKFFRNISYKYNALSEFLKKFNIDILLKKNETNYVILEMYLEKSLYIFRPYIYVKKEGFKLIKVFTDNRELVKKSYIFSLGPPYLSDGTKTVFFLIYDFFNMGV